MRSEVFKNKSTEKTGLVGPRFAPRGFTLYDPLPTGDWAWVWVWVTQASRLGRAWAAQGSRLGHPWVEWRKRLCLQQECKKAGWVTG